MMYLTLRRSGTDFFALNGLAFFILSLFKSFTPFDSFSQVKIRIKVVAGSSSGVVATEAKKAQSNWVILDK